MLAIDSNKRPTAAQSLQSTFFESMQSEAERIAAQQQAQKQKQKQQALQQEMEQQQSNRNRAGSNVNNNSSSSNNSSNTNNNSSYSNNSSSRRASRSENQNQNQRRPSQAGHKHDGKLPSMEWDQPACEDEETEKNETTNPASGPSKLPASLQIRKWDPLAGQSENSGLAGNRRTSSDGNAPASPRAVNLSIMGPMSLTHEAEALGITLSPRLLTPTRELGKKGKKDRGFGKQVLSPLAQNSDEKAALKEKEKKKRKKQRKRREEEANSSDAPQQQELMQVEVPEASAADFNMFGGMQHSPVAHSRALQPVNIQSAASSSPKKLQAPCMRVDKTFIKDARKEGVVPEKQVSSGKPSNGGLLGMLFCGCWGGRNRMKTTPVVNESADTA